MSDLTAETITDEQIRELRPCAELSRIELEDALRPPSSNGGLNIRRGMARIRCAALINARASRKDVP